LGHGGHHDTSKAAERDHLIGSEVLRDSHSARLMEDLRDATRGSARSSGRGGSGRGGSGRLSEELQQVAFGDATILSRALDLGEIDAVLLGKEADSGRSENDALALAGADLLSNLLVNHGLGSRRGRRRRRRGRSHGGRRWRRSGGGRSRGVMAAMTARGGNNTLVDLNVAKGRSDLSHVTRFVAELLHHTMVARGDGHRGLVALDLAKRSELLDGGALLNVPLEHLNLANALTDI